MAEILNHEGQPAFVIMPYAEYQALQNKLEELEDVEAYREAKADLAKGEEELIPKEVVDRLLAENPVKVWREYRGIKQKELADLAEVKPSYLSQIENGNRQGSVDTLKRVARALSIDLDDLT